jgi:hypothetical protein
VLGLSENFKSLVTIELFRNLILQVYLLYSPGQTLWPFIDISSYLSSHAKAEVIHGKRPNDL